MKKSIFLIGLFASAFGFSQTSDPGVTSTAAASGNHAFVGTHPDGVFSDWLGTGTSATAYNLLGSSNAHGGFGLANGSNIVSPIVWMYANSMNAFRVRTMNYGADITGGTDLFTVRANGNVGIGTSQPNVALEINKNFDGSTASYLINSSATSNSRTIFLLGEQATGGNYGYLAHHSTNYLPTFGNYTLANTTLLAGNDTNGLVLFAGNTQGKIVFGTGSSEKMRISPDGNVGIGTTSPSAKLEIKGGNDVGISLYNDQANYWDIINSTYGKLDFVRGKTNIFMRIDQLGNVGIGTTNPATYKLAVNGNIRAKEVKVETGWSDFVFEKDYGLPSLEEVEKHIAEKGHLKDIPSAKEVAENGIFLGEMDSKLLQKIEELTLYTIAQENRIKQLESENSKIKAQELQIKEIEAKLNAILAVQK